MFYFKACPKCHGDLYLDSDGYGSFIECVQCGLLRDLVDRQIGRADRILNLNCPPVSRYPLALSA